MSNIAKAFEHGKAFIPFVTCGDPSLDVTEEVVYAMVEAGADLIELGIPFSDPTAEGPVIQGANIRALAGGVTTDKVFDLVRKLRKKSDNTYGVHDICKCRVLVRFGEIHQHMQGDWHRRSDPS